MHRRHSAARGNVYGGLHTLVHQKATGRCWASSSGLSSGVKSSAARLGDLGTQRRAAPVVFVLAWHEQ